MDRPTQVAEILKTVSKSHNTSDIAPLEAYLVDLETNQLDRPTPIGEILQKISAQLPADLVAILETYISGLESKQQVKQFSDDDKTSSYDPENPPKWSQIRQRERNQHRRERAERNRKAFH